MRASSYLVVRLGTTTKGLLLSLNLLSPVTYQRLQSAGFPFEKLVYGPLLLLRECPLGILSQFASSPVSPVSTEARASPLLVRLFVLFIGSILAPVTCLKRPEVP